MIFHQDDYYYAVVIGKDADNTEEEILIGIGPHVDSENKETSKLYLRVQRGRNDNNPTRSILSISQGTIFLKALDEAIENAKEIEQNILRRTKKK